MVGSRRALMVGLLMLVTAVAFEAQAWQDDPAKPIASAFGHFMLRRTPGAEDE